MSGTLVPTPSANPTPSKHSAHPVQPSHTATPARSDQAAQPAPGLPGRSSRLLGLPLGIAFQAAISAGDGIATVALANRVFQASHASWAVAAVFLAVTIPISALAPVSGLVLDRLPVKPVLAAAAVAEAAIAVALIWATSLTGTLILATGFGLCAALLQPGMTSIVPRLTTPERVTKANSYLQAASWAGFTGGPLLAGALIAVSGSGLALAANGAGYALGAAAMAALVLAPRGPAAAGDGRGEPLGRQLRAGLRFLRADVDAGLLVLVIGVVSTFANMAMVAEVVLAEQVLRSGPSGYALLTAGWTAGMIVGTLAGGRLRSRWLLGTALTGAVLTGLGIALAGIAATLWLAVAAYAAGGLANGLESVATLSYLGSRAPRHLAGRVFAVYSGIVFGGISVGMAVAAGLLTGVGARGTLLIAGGGAMIAALAGMAAYLIQRRSARRLLAEAEASGCSLRPAPAGPGIP